MSATLSAVQSRRTLRARHNVRIALARVVVFVVFVALWQVASYLHLFDPGIVPSPLAIGAHLWKITLDGSLEFNAWITIQETVGGFLIGAIGGIVLGFAVGRYPALAEVLDPFILAVYSVPKVALAPLFVVWFGIGIWMKIVLAAVTVLFIVFFNTLAGVRNVDRDLVDAVWLMGAKPRDVLFKVLVPSAMSWALTGVRIAIPYALIGAIIGELIASNRGIGYLISAAASGYDTAGVFAVLIVLTILAMLLNAVVDVIDRRLSKWKVDASVTIRGT
ncbi:MAG TPA: ABC transporter permease [Candidatus Lustribacter sp.]